MTSAPIRRIRRAARIVLVDQLERVLLFRYVPEWLPAFWLLPGGECEHGEDFAAAARRELQEETGIIANPHPMGIVRQFDYMYEGAPVRGIEHFFLHRAAGPQIDTSGHSDVEKRAMQEYRWFAATELCDWHEPLYPADIGTMIDQVFLREI